MPRGDKSAYTDKQKRKAQHIEEGYREQGLSEDEAERRAWATVNKESGGGAAHGGRRCSGVGGGLRGTAKCCVFIQYLDGLAPAVFCSQTSRWASPPPT